MTTVFNFILSAAVAPNLLIPLLIFMIAVLYSSVGYGGASGYLAIFSLFSFAVSNAEIASTVLVMNLLVAGSAGYVFYKTGHFRLNLFWPFAIASIPLSFVGGIIKISFGAYAFILSLVLLFAACRMLLVGEHFRMSRAVHPALWMQFLLGGCIGLISGVIGIGGGIFLSPIILFLGLANAKETAAVSALFIVLNSFSGIAGRMIGGNFYVTGLLLTSLAAACIGGQVGSRLGAHRFSNTFITRVLGAILMFAGIKLLLSAI